MLHNFLQVETTRKILSFHREERNSDPNNPQSILLDFVSSCQNLRIWSLNTSTREYLNNEQLQKGKQIDEWWKQVSKGIFNVAFALWFLLKAVWLLDNCLLFIHKVYLQYKCIFCLTSCKLINLRCINSDNCNSFFFYLKVIISSYVQNITIVIFAVKNNNQIVVQVACCIYMKFGCSHDRMDWDSLL